MTNLETIKAFSLGQIGCALHLYSDGRRLFSYNTCIAEYYKGRLIVNNTKYSITTSTHRSNLLTEVLYGTEDPISIISVINVPIGTQSLIQYI